MNKQLITFIAALLFYPLFSHAQSNYEDVVYLKNGSVIHGIIIEQVPNKTIKIQTKDGNLFVYKMDEIDKLTKEIPNNNTKEPVQKIKDTILHNRYSSCTFNIGIASPIGAYNTQSGAIHGLTFNISSDIPVNHSNIGFSIMGGFWRNPTYDYTSTSYYQGVYLTAGTFVSIPIDKFSFVFHLRGGIVSINQPAVEYYYSGYYNTTVNTVNSTINSISFMVNVGEGANYRIGKHLLLQMCFDLVYSQVNINPDVTIVTNRNLSVLIINSTLGAGYQF